MKLRTEHGNTARVSFPKFGTFEFNPEGDVPDEFKEAIDHLLADGYVEVKGKVQAKKDEPVKVITPPAGKEGVEAPFICDVCGQGFEQKIALMGHSRKHQNFKKK